MKKIVKDYYCNKHCTLPFQLITGFVLGLIIGPIANGIFFLLLFLLLTNCFLYIFSHGKDPYWNTLNRSIVIIYYLLGWLLGRFLTLPVEDLIHHGVPSFNDIALE